MTKRTLAAMSGGIDSSVAALLLKQQGHDVLGITLKLFTHAPADEADAQRVCAQLGFAHQVCDLSLPFQQLVIDRFAGAYLAGKTPNPCIYCNRQIKFGALSEQARLLGCDHLATGHYARCEFDQKSGRWLLKKAADPTKDQTYVLYSLSQAQLAMTLFPLGGMTKQAARAMAAEYGLLNAEKPDSQDICFVEGGDYAAFLTNVLGLCSPPGDFIDSEGRVLGRHRGLIHYTVGQRKGLGLSFGAPRYVVSLDAAANTVTLGEEDELYGDTLIVAELNFISIPALIKPLRVGVKARYKQTEVPATLTPTADGRVQVRFDTPQRALTPGQAAVFYDGDIVVGGGIIQ